MRLRERRTNVSKYSGHYKFLRDTIRDTLEVTVQDLWKEKVADMSEKRFVPSGTAAQAKADSGAQGSPINFV